MKGKLIWFVLAVLLLMPLGCVTSQKISDNMASWVGHNKMELMGSWGAPAQVMSDGSGGEVWAYSQARSYTSPGSSTTNVYGSTYGNSNYSSGYATGQTTYYPGQTYSYQAQRLFYIDSDGKIYNWSWKGK